MRKMLRRMIGDLERGENVDLYVTVLGALVVAGLNLFGAASQGLIGSLTLAVLALLASSILGNRHRLEDIQERIGEAADSEILKEFPEELASDLERASEIWLFGVHVIAAVRESYQLLESKLKRGKTLRVLVVDPYGAAVSMTAARVPGKPSVDRERANILANLDDLVELRKIAPDRLEIRTIDDPMFYGGYLLDPDRPDGVVYLRRYTYQYGLTPKFVYHRRDRQWFDLVKSELNSLWNRANEWKGQQDGNQ